MSKQYSYIDFLEKIRSHGEKLAIIDEASGRSYDYDELCTISEKLTVVLKKEGLKKGDRILLFAVDGISWVPLFLASQLIGVIVVPVDTRVSSDLLLAVIKKTKPKLIVNDSSIEVPVPKKSVIKSKKLLDSVNAIKNSPDLKKINPETKGQILLTSGTWSEPKGVTLTQANVLTNMLATSKVYDLKSDEKLLSILPLSHAYEQMCGLHLPLNAGCTIVYLSEITGSKIKSAVKKHKITLIVGVPRILDLFQKGILRQIPEKKRPLVLRINRLLRFTPIAVRRKFFAKVHTGLGPTLKTLVIGGAPLPLETDKFFQGLGYKTLLGYGLSETSPIISVNLKQYGRRQGDVGAVLKNIDCKINSSGELLVKGPSIFYGYWPNSRNEKWFNTGDIVEENSGNIRLTGRSKNLIIFANGDKVNAEEIEHKVDGIKDIEESIVISHETSNGNSKGITVAYRSEKDVNIESLEELLEGFLPSSARLINAINVFPDSLDRTHTMKLARKEAHRKFRSSR